jgi:hypothetical protein
MYNVNFFTENWSQNANFMLNYILLPKYFYNKYNYVNFFTKN